MCSVGETFWCQIKYNLKQTETAMCLMWPTYAENFPKTVTMVTALIPGTWKTGVTCFQIRHEFLRTWVNGVQRSIRDHHLAWRSTGTHPVQVRQDVGGTSRTSVIFSHATPEPHTSVSCWRHHYHVIHHWIISNHRWAAGVERLPLAVLCARMTSQWQYKHGSIIIIRVIIFNT